MKQLLLLFSLVILGIGLPLFVKFSETVKNIENYSNYNLDEKGIYPESQTNVLLQDTYPTIGKNELSNGDSSDIWQKYPIFQLGSYNQSTNNIKYPNNPDEGTCMPVSMCNAIYKDITVGDNMIEQLPPLDPHCGRRVGYFGTDVNLLSFRTNMQNILY